MIKVLFKEHLLIEHMNEPDLNQDSANTDVKDDFEI